MGWVIKGWVAMYTLRVGLGFTFSIDDLVKEFSSWLTVSPSKINPNTLRILVIADFLNKQHLRLELTVRNLFHAYSTQMVTRDAGHVQFWLKIRRWSISRTPLQVPRTGGTESEVSEGHMHLIFLEFRPP